MTMLEKMAVASWARWRAGTSWNGHVGQAERHFRENAVLRAEQMACMAAALRSLREPDEAMLDAAIAPFRYGNTDEFNAVFKKIVAGYMRAMVDAILASDQGEKINAGSSGG
jgi:hypothetical protein